MITISRPEARNALDGAVGPRPGGAVDELDADGDLRAGVLTGAGGTFCSGMDLKAYLKGETPALRRPRALRYHQDAAAEAADRRGRG